MVKKAKYPFSQFLAPFEENNQKLVRNEGINSILCIETEPIKIKTGKNNLLQPYLSFRHLLDDHNILNNTKNRAETTYLNIFLRIKSGSFWVQDRNKPFEMVYEKSEFGNRFVEHKAFRIDTFQHSVVKNRKDTELIFSLKRFRIIP